MKKFYFATLLIMFLATPALLAQDDKDSLTTSKTEVDRYPSFKGFVTNKFWDNWEISIGGGVGTAMNGGNDPGDIGKRLGYFGEISITKWLHPVVGFRGELQGGVYTNFTDNLTKMTWPNFLLHGDIMVNLSNWIGGYKENRVYYAVPYIGIGYFASNFTEATRSVNGYPTTMGCIAATYGLLNKFRVSPSVDINLELEGMVGMADANPALNANRGLYLNGLNASVGVTYRFGKRDFERGAAGYTPEAIKALKQEAENAAIAAKETEQTLGDQLADAKEAAAAAEQRVKEAESQLAEANAEVEALRNQQALDAATPEEMVFFDFAMAVLTPADKIRLDVLASKIKAGPADYVYTITGYADFNTGEKAKNTALAEKRARVVNDYLVSLGVPASQLTYKGAGADEQPFSSEGNQTVIIK
ncbi:MAG TPA: OmpA family protein [Candidatus Coprenecus stercoravium]|uniref:OmpA family protein n=1 Tax=Candidatus Coprenecus stercoravium TaxID=2840735 RepID=A0A9D2GPT6_9BACT|nr:OmpA family protein [Candidatus Coprenecus stercoravium]